jgi:arylsulfatase A
MRIKVSILKRTNRKFFYFAFVFYFSMIGFTGCKKDFEEKSTLSASTTNLAGVSTKPNIILILFNDFGFEIPTFNGGQSYSTPNLDFLAANGMEFGQFYNHPDGTPSRLALLTGKYNFRNYVKWGYLPPKEKTVGNMLKDAGYATCWVGKWQLEGGASRIMGAGFKNYLVFLPSGHGQRLNRYKDPHLYENGAYLPDSVTAGKYSEDMFYDYLSNFIDNNKTKPFFAMYATLLPAQPWVPTPDDPKFATWNPDWDNKRDDKKYFPEMVSYIDKIVGKVVQKVKDEGLENNTIILVTSATQTDSRITSMWNGQMVTGTKTNTFKAGTNLPLIAYWPGHIAPGNTQQLCDFTDFMPSMADMAGIPVPTTYGTLDGTTFYDDMLNIKGKDRDWVFCQWDNNPIDDVSVERWINNKVYKLYDTVGNGNGKFYKIKDDIYEKNPIPDSLLTPAQLQLKQQFRAILDTMHK